MRKCWQWFGCGLVVPILSGCSGSVDPPEDGIVIVTVTLSRSSGGGAAGPNIDHAPQSNVDVTVADGREHAWSDRTDENGAVRIPIPPGEYDVEVKMCPDAPKPVKVSAGETMRVRFDCVAP